MLDLSLSFRIGKVAPAPYCLLFSFLATGEARGLGNLTITGQIPRLRCAWPSAGQRARRPAPLALRRGRPRPLSRRVAVYRGQCMAAVPHGRGAGAAGAPDAVRVVLESLGAVEVDDRLDEGDVEAS